jgi:nucleoside 2-deoxyribosyltransferase
MLYLIGSLRNPEVPKIANQLRSEGFGVFDDWYAAGPEADDKWRDYEKGRGRSYMEALAGAAAKNVFQFDRKHLERADAVILVLPAGKSGHLELGWSLGRGKRGYILLDSPDRWDVMYQFADLVTDDLDETLDEEADLETPSAT